MKKNKGILVGAIFILVMLGALAVAEWYQLRYIARIREGAYVINSPEIAKNLTRGIEPEDPTFALMSVKKGDDVYRRGKSLYVGTERKKVEEAYPFFTNDGNAVMIVQDSSVLIDDSFTENTTYKGMYVSAGLSFNYDKIQADDVDYLLLKLDNGLYMNAQPIRFDYPGGDKSVRMNSVFYFGTDAVRYYAVRDGETLAYGELPTVNMMTVTIGGKTYSYEQFLQLLGISENKPAWKRRTPDTGKPAVPLPLKEVEPKVNSALLPEEFERFEEEEKEKEENIIEKKEPDEAERQKKEASLEERKRERDKQRQENANKAVVNNSTADTSTPAPEKPNNTTDDRPSVSGNAVSGNDVSANDLYLVPVASISEFKEDIYSIDALLDISDPSFTLKRVEIELYWRNKQNESDENKNDPDAYELQYRKSYRVGGEITIDNLPPDTFMYARGVVVYSIAGETKRHEFYNGLTSDFGSPLKTKPLSEMDDIYVQFNSEYPETEQVLPNQMQLFGFSLSGPNPNVLQRVQSIQIEVTPVDAQGDSAPYVLEMIENAGRFRQTYSYKESGEVWVSDQTKVFLPSSMNFNYRITLYDRFGNPFKRVVEGYRRQGAEMPEDAETPEDAEMPEETETPEIQEAPEDPEEPAVIIDWDKDKSLSHDGEWFKKYTYEGNDGYKWDNAAEKSTLTGTSHTSRTAPVVTITQKRFDDNAPNSARARFEIGIRDTDGAIIDDFKPGRGDSYFLTILKKGEDDVFVPCAFKNEAEGAYITDIKSIEEGGVERSYRYLDITEDNFPAEDTENGIASQTYDIYGLTAGCVYEIRIYGKYDLADNICAEAKVPRIWSQQFVTADLTSYGSIAYNISNAHIKTEIWPYGDVNYDPETNSNLISPYESATAQEITISLNQSQTSEVLRDMMSDIMLQMTTKAGTETAGDILTASFDVDKMKTIMAIDNDTAQWATIDEASRTGRYPLDWEAVYAGRLTPDGPAFVDKTPQLYLEDTIPVSGEAPSSVWELFLRGAKFVIRWEDDDGLTSNTEYQMDLQTFATQGDAYHDVSARSSVYKSRNFRTLKKMPYVEVDSRNVLIVSDYIKMPMIKFHDDDRAIEGGTLSSDGNLLRGAVQTVLEMKEGNNPLKKSAYIDLNYDYGPEGAKVTGGVCEMLEYHGLVNGDSYEISFIPAAIIRDSRSGDYSIRREVLFAYPFRVGEGLDGNIILNEITFPMAGETTDQKSILRSDYSLYDAGDFTMGAMKTDGTIADDSNIPMTSTDDVQAASGFIEVEPGGIYYLEGFRGDSTTNETRVYFYANKDQGNATRVTTIDRKEWVADVNAKVDDNVQNYSNYFRLKSGSSNKTGNVIRIPEGINYIRFTMRGRDKTTLIPAYVTANCFKLKSADENAQDVLQAVTCVEDPASPDGIYHIKNRPSNMNNDKSTMIEVTPGETYAIAQGYHYYQYYFYDVNGKQLSSENSYYGGSTIQLSKIVTVPSGAKGMKIWAYTGANSSLAPYLTASEKTLVYKIDMSKLKELESKDPERFYTAFRVEVKDNKNNLINEEDRKVYLKVYNETDKLAVDLKNQSRLKENANECITDYKDGYNIMQMALDETGAATIDLSETLQYLSDSHKTFTLELYVKYNNNMILLDSQTIETSRPLITINNRKSMSRVARYPNADFLVTADIEMATDDKTWNSMDAGRVPFEGTIDFQGHRLTTTYSGQDGYLFQGFNHDAVLENLILNTTFDPEPRMFGDFTYRGGLIGSNYGTLRNIVVNFSLGLENYSRQSYTASICRINYGLIENFFLNFNASSRNYVGTDFGGICRDNYGTIRNGFVYTPNPLSLTTGKYKGDATKDVSYTGLVTSKNQGTLENILTHGDLAVELVNGVSQKITTSALLTGTGRNAGSNQGVVRNCLSVGDLLGTYWIETGVVNDAGDMIYRKDPRAYNYSKETSLVVYQTHNLVWNNYYYSRKGSTYKPVDGKVQAIDDPVVFRDLDFYDRTVNRGGAFHLADVGIGYYPRIEMPYQGMMLAQVQVPLEMTPIDVSVKYLYAENVEVHYTDDDDYDPNIGYGHDYAMATLVFQNEPGREIDTFQADGLLFMNPDDNVHNVVNNRNTAVKLKSVYQSQEESLYKVKVKMAVNELTTGKALYRDSYKVTGFRYGQYKGTVKNNQNINVTFYKLVTQDNWLTVFNNDMGSCFRLHKDGIDFNKEPLLSNQSAASKVLAGTFTGVLDGRGNSIRNFRFGGLGATSNYSPYMIKVLQGTLKNIRFENTTIDGTGYTVTGSMGLIQTSELGAKIEGIVIKDMNITGGIARVGALVASSTRTTIEDCVVSGLTMEHWNESATGIYAGGLVAVGVTNTSIRNCLTKGIDIKALSSYYANGLGGMAGSLDASCNLENCYAEGSVQSSSKTVGGLVGENAGRISSCWAKVAVYTDRYNLGGIVGTGAGKVNRVLSAGEIYTSSKQAPYNRIGGTGAKSRCYATAVQNINGEKSTNLDDATGLLSREELQLETTYWETINLGGAFDCSVVKGEKGYLPLLYYRDGHALLPEQEIGNRVPLPLEWRPFTAAGIAEVMEQAEWTTGVETAENGKTSDYDLTVSFDFIIPALSAADFDVTADDNRVKSLSPAARECFGERFSKISVEGLRFAEDANGFRAWPTVTFGEEGALTLTFDDMRAEQYIDRYEARWQTPDGPQTVELAFKMRKVEGETEILEDTYLYRYIYRAEQNEAVAAKFAEIDAARRSTAADPVAGRVCDPNSWEGAMKLAGNSWENFLIMEDLDFGFIKVEGKTLQTGLRVGRLEGGKKYRLPEEYKEYQRKDYLMADLSTEAENRFYKIQNLEYTTSSSDNSRNWFYMIIRGLSDLHFKDITWTQNCASNFDTACLINGQRAPMEYVDIENVTINYGTEGTANKNGSWATGKLGFIGDTTDVIRYVRGRDIKIHTPNTKLNRTTSYAGGIVGYANDLNADVNHVGVKGRKEADGSWSYDIVGSKTRVRSGDGGVSGNTNNTNGTYEGGIFGRGKTGLFCYADTIHVVGNGYTGGLTGSLTSNSFNSYTQATVNGMQKDGIVIQQRADEEDSEEKLYLAEVKNSKIEGGYITSGIDSTSSGVALHYCRSKNNEILSYTYAGGLTGYHNTVALEYCMVSGCKVTATELGAGGLSGAHFKKYSFNSIVRNCTISAPKYVGGIATVQTNNSTEFFSTGYVYNCAIYGDKWIGGAYGLTSGDSVYGTVVKDCWIGRDVANHKHPEVVKDASGQWVKTWVDDEDGSDHKAVMVGGLVGGLYGTQIQLSVVEDDVQVWGSKYVGGVIGAGGGGSNAAGTGITQYVQTGAKVHVTEGYGGGFAGLLTTYERKQGLSEANSTTDLSRPVTRMANVIVAGEVDGGTTAEWVGGFVGAYTYKSSPNSVEIIYHPETGEILQQIDKATGYKDYISQNNFSRIVLALTSVNGKTGCVGILSGFGEGGAVSETYDDPDYKDYSQSNKPVPDRRAIIQDSRVDSNKLAYPSGTTTVDDYRGISGLRIFGGTKINDRIVADHKLVEICSGKTMAGGTVSDTFVPLQKPWNYRGTTMADYMDPMYVTTANLKSIDFYYAAQTYGGLDIRALNTQTDYYTGTGNTTPNKFYNMYYEESRVNVENGVFPLVTRQKGASINNHTYDEGWYLGCWEPVDGNTTMYDGIPIPTQTFAALPTTANLLYALDQVTPSYASGPGAINMEWPEVLVTEAATKDEEISSGSVGEGISLMSLDDGDVEAGISLMSLDDEDVDAEAVMPVEAGIRKASARVMSVAEDDADEDEGISLMSLDDEDVDAEVIIPESYFEIYDESGTLLYRNRIEQRVYTLPYDFASMLTIKVYAGDATRTYIVDADSARNTVMTWQDHCYYLKADGVYRDKGVYQADANDTTGVDDADSVGGKKATGTKDYANTERVLEGSFVHLYGGKALAEDGRVYDVVSGKVVDQLDETELFVPAKEETPAYETNYGGMELLTYRTFTATAEEEKISDYRLFARDDKLFGMDPELDQPYGENFQDFVADYYATSQGSAEYLSALTENGTLADYRTALNWPTDEKKRKILDNYGICEVGDNLNSDRSYVVIRYENNVAAAFDYQTGSLLFIDDSEKETVDFITFVNTWMNGKKAALQTGTAYLNAKGLLGDLLDSPIDDELIVGSVKGKNEVGADGDPEGILLDIATNGVNVTSGENRTETGENGAGSRAETEETSIATVEAVGSVADETLGISTVGKSDAGAAVNADLPGDANGNGIGAGSGKDAVNGSGAVDGSDAVVGKDAANGSDADGENDAVIGSDADGREGAELTGRDGEGKTTGADGEGKADDADGRGNGAGDETGIGAGSGTGVGTGNGTGTAAGSGTGSGAGTGTGSDTGIGTGTGGGSGNGTGTGTESDTGIGTGTGDGSGTGAADGNSAATGSGTGTDAGNEVEEYPPLTSDLAYVTMLTAKGGGYEIFRASELLNRSGNTLLSENQKLKMLEASGIRRNTIDLENMKLTEEENRTGIMLVGSVVAAMMLLLGLLYYKKRKMNQMM